MVRWNSRHEGRAVPLDDADSLRGAHIDFPQNADIERTLAEFVELFERREFPQGDHDIGMTLPKTTNRLRQSGREHRQSRIADVDRAKLTARGRERIGFCTVGER